MKIWQLKQDKKGFTLIELSVVIVIIALLLAGISIGSEVAKNAKLNSVIEDFQKFQIAFTAFRDRYRGVPGDIATASAYWPTGGDCAVTASNCNGNGDGFIEYGGYEMHSALKQLNLSGLIDNSIKAVPDTYGGQTLSFNVFASKIRGSGYVMFADQISQNLPNDNPFFNSYRPTIETNTVFLARANSAGTVEFDVGVISAQDAFTIDKKMDDGVTDDSGNFTGATSGMVRVYGVDVNGVECVINHTAADANSYNITADACLIGRALN